MSDQYIHHSIHITQYRNKRGDDPSQSQIRVNGMVKYKCLKIYHDCYSDCYSTATDRCERARLTRLQTDSMCTRSFDYCWKRTGGPVCCCCCCLHIKSRSGLYSVLSSIRTGPTDADAFRGHRLTTQKGYTYQKKIKGPRKVSTHAIV